MKPQLSIITVNLNERDQVRKTIESVARQTYKNIEFIVVDGGSTDGSVDLIKSSAAITRFISEPDAGISDAFNKGINLATGDWIQFLNAGDVYLNNDSLATIARHLKKSELLSAQVLYRNLPFPDRRVFQSSRLSQRAMIHHQASFIPRDWFQKYGLYRTDFRIRMDYEFWLRTLKREKLTPLEIPIVDFDAGKSFRDINNYYLEEMKANALHFKTWPLMNAYCFARFVARSALRKFGFNV